MQTSLIANKRMNQLAISFIDIELIKHYGFKLNRRRRKIALSTDRSRKKMINDGISPQIADRLKGFYV